EGTARGHDGGDLVAAGDGAEGEHELGARALLEAVEQRAVELVAPVVVAGDPADLDDGARAARRRGVRRVRGRGEQRKSAGDGGRGERAGGAVVPHALSSSGASVASGASGSSSSRLRQSSTVTIAPSAAPVTSASESAHWSSAGLLSPRVV